MACYIVTGIYGDDCLFTIALKTFVDWVEDNQENLSQSIVKYHLAMALAHDVSTFLGRYLNACVRDFCTTGLEVPGYKKKCSLEHIISDLSCGPYQGVTNLSPSLKDLLAHRDAQCVGWGLANPGGAEACHLHKVTERSMEESSNLQEGERDVPSEGGFAPEAAAAASADASQVAGQVDPHTDQRDPVDNPQVKPIIWGLATPGSAEARHLHKVAERSMEEASNLQEGGRDVPSEGGVPHRQWRQLQQTQNKWQAR